MSRESDFVYTHTEEIEAPFVFFFLPTRRLGL